jgi:hypothetical protein
VQTPFINQFSLKTTPCKHRLRKAEVDYGKGSNQMVSTLKQSKNFTTKEESQAQIQASSHRKLREITILSGAETQ